MRKKKTNIFSFMILFLLIFVSWSYAVEKKKYPPYPNVWGYEFPWPAEGSRYSGINVFEMHDGDFMVTYTKKRIRTDNKIEFSGILFFSQKKVDFSPQEYENFHKKHEKRKVGAHYVVVDEDIELSQTADCLGKCCPSFSRHLIEKKDTRNGEILARINSIYILEKPLKIHIDPATSCENMPGWQNAEGQYYYTHVLWTYPMFVPLKDGTFLLLDKIGNFIMRYNKNLNSKSDLSNRRVFMVDRNAIKTLEDKLLRERKFNEQIYSDEVYNYLMKLKKEGGK